MVLFDIPAVIRLFPSCRFFPQRKVSSLFPLSSPGFLASSWRGTTTHGDDAIKIKVDVTSN